jgi:predicted DNA-binding transcriptional regulator AlpA
MPDANADRLIPIKEVARRLSYSVRQISRWIDNGTFPKPVRLGKRRMYHESTINELVERLRAG